MIFRAKLTSCRSFILLLITGLIFLTVNITLLWNQQQGTPHNICVCEPSINVPRPNSNLDTKLVKAPIDLSRPERKNMKPTEDSLSPNLVQNRTKELLSSHQLAVVVPFRNRYEEMMEFVPHIHKFLNRQNVRHQILVINQADKHRYISYNVLGVSTLHTVH